MHYYQHHIGDFIKDTNFLTNEEVGIYLKMLWLYYDTEKPLPNSLFQISMKVNGRDKEEIIEGLLDMFFTLQDGAWHHKRCDKEIEQYHKQVQTASKAGKASAAKRAQNREASEVQRPFNDRSTSEQPTSNQEPRTRESRATRLPPDWEPSDELIAFMRKERPDLNPSHTIMKFCNYWQAKSGKDATKLDWDKTFQNWVLAEKEGKAKPASQDPFASRGGV
jgi:uncharacterized protein YdaU (DUF1376 family)